MIGTKFKFNTIKILILDLISLHHSEIIDFFKNKIKKKGIKQIISVIIF